MRLIQGRLLALLAGALAVIVYALGSPSVLALAGDSPGGFYYGLDTNSSNPYPSGSGPYQEPTTGGIYGGYIGRVAAWYSMPNTGCTGSLTQPYIDFNATDASDANYNYNYYRSATQSLHPLGSGGYWYMAGPGVNPNYDNGNMTNAYNWGADQAQQAHNYWTTITKYKSITDTADGYLPFAVMWMDIEQANDSSTYTNGWNYVATNGTCGKKPTNPAIPSDALDRQTFNGSWTYINSIDTANIVPGAYSMPSYWNKVFATGYSGCSASPYCPISYTFEWASHQDFGDYSPDASGWYQAVSNTCPDGSQSYWCAEFFGTQTQSSSYAISWQWCYSTSYCRYDYDQIDTNPTYVGW